MLTQYTVLFIYFIILFSIGIVASKRIKNIEDYYVGGKKLGYWVVAFSVRATGESGWLLLGLTGLGAFAGVSAFWVVFGEVLGVSVAWFLMAKRFKRLSDKYKSITVPDFLVSHFKSKTNTLRVVAATALSLFVVIYVSAQIDAIGSAFESFLNWNYYTGALVGFAIVLIYIAYGGFLAVVWSDVFQGILMFFGLVLLPIYIYSTLDSGVNILEGLNNIDEGLTNIWGSGGATTYNIATIFGYAMIGLGFMGSPQLFVRFMSIKNEDEIKKGRWVAIVFTLLTDGAAVCIGILGRYLFTSTGQDVEEILGNNAQNVLPYIIDNMLPLIVSGIYIAVVLAAIMSTIDSLLVVASSAITRDFYQQIINPKVDSKQLSKISKIVTIAMAIFALSIALIVAVSSPTRTIFWFIIFGWSGIAATFCPVIILSLFWKGYNEKGAIASMITGFLGIPIFEFVVPLIPGIGIYFTQVAELLPSFLLAMSVGYIVSRFTT
ncbi:MAG: sodium/proline symporter [Cyclobacteriaceae bacterium]|nr:sodium/proline symporter [Cyclobacteriaceae bacterium]